MANNIVLHASQSKVSVDNWDIKTGEYNIQDCSVVFEEDLKEALTDQYKWFAVFKYDKREYESEIDLDVNSENKPFDMPVFSKPGYVNVGVYGYEYAIGTINKEQVAEKVAGINTYTGHPVNWCMSDFDLTDDFKETYGEFIDTDTVKFDTFTNKYTLTFKTIIVGGAERELPAGTKITVKYKYRPLNPETGDPIMRLRYSPSMQLCEVKNGSSPVQPIPSPGTYAKLNQRIDELGEGIHDTETMRNWWHNFTQNQEVLNLREVFNTMTESGSYVASYKNIYNIIEDYFGEGPTIGRPVGDKLFEIQYFQINLTEQNNAWVADKTYIQIKAAIKEGKLPIIHYVTNEDNNYAIYSNHSDDGIVFSETKTIVQEGSTEHQIEIINFTINEFNVVTRERVVVNDIDASKFELLVNKAVAVNEEDPEELQKLKYISEFALIQYIQGKFHPENFELVANKVQDVDDSSTHYPSTAAIVKYSEKVGNKQTTIDDDDTHYPSTSAVVKYAEDKSNKAKILEEVKTSDDKYPTAKAVVEYIAANSSVKFNKGVSEIITPTEGPTIAVTQELVYVIPSGAAPGTVETYLRNQHIQTETVVLYSPSSGVTIKEKDVDGKLVLEITQSPTADTDVRVNYSYKQIKEKYLMHFYNGDTCLDDKIAPFDLTFVHGGGGGGAGGTSFNEVELTEDDNNQVFIKFKKNGTYLQIDNGSLSRIQLSNNSVSSATATEETQGGTTVDLESYDNTLLTTVFIPEIGKTDLDALKDLI